MLSPARRSGWSSIWVLSQALPPTLLETALKWTPTTHKRYCKLQGQGIYHLSVDPLSHVYAVNSDMQQVQTDPSRAYVQAHDVTLCALPGVHAALPFVHVPLLLNRSAFVKVSSGEGIDLVLTKLAVSQEPDGKLPEGTVFWSRHIWQWSWASGEYPPVPLSVGCVPCLV